MLSLSFRSTNDHVMETLSDEKTHFLTEVCNITFAHMHQSVFFAPHISYVS